MDAIVLWSNLEKYPNLGRQPFGFPSSAVFKMILGNWLPKLYSLPILSFIFSGGNNPPTDPANIPEASKMGEALCQV